MTTVDVLSTICKKTDEPLVLVTDRGFDGLLKYSNEKKMKKPLITRWKRRTTVFRSRFMKSAENRTTTNAD